MNIEKCLLKHETFETFETKKRPCQNANAILKILQIKTSQ